MFIKVLESKFYCLIKASVLLSRIKQYLINYIPFPLSIFSKLVIMGNQNSWHTSKLDSCFFRK